MSAVLTDGVLVVGDSPLSDDIRIYRQPGPTDAPVYTVEIGPLDGRRPTRMWMFPAHQVKSVLVRAGPGNDVVDLGAATFPLPRSIEFGPVSVPTRIDGGIGDDRMYGGTSRDLVSDRFGNDRVEGGDGDDWINGGWGNDFLSGGRGNDYVSGSYGNDYVHGDDGDDRLNGGPGNDHVGFNAVGPLNSEPGNDILFGGSGEDWMVGGSGRDRIFGGTGKDRWSLEDDDSEMRDRTPDEPKDVPAGV